MLFPIVKGTTVRLRGAMSRTIDRLALTGKVDKTDLLLTIGVRTLGHSGRTLGSVGTRFTFYT